MKDQLILRATGIVKQTLVLTGEVIRHKPNLVVDSSLEVMIQALFGGASVAGVSFGKTGGRPVTKSLRSIGAPVGFAKVNEFADTKNFASKDDRGLRTVGTWTAILKPSTSITYDTLGLITNTNQLVAANSFDPVTLVAEQAIAVQWTILLRGK